MHLFVILFYYNIRFWSSKFKKKKKDIDLEQNRISLCYNYFIKILIIILDIQTYHKHLLFVDVFLFNKLYKNYKEMYILCIII